MSSSAVIVHELLPLLLLLLLHLFLLHQAHSLCVSLPLSSGFVPVEEALQYKFDVD